MNMDRIQSLRLTMTLDDPDLLKVRCSTLRSSLGEDLDSFFPKFDETIHHQEVNDRSDLFFDDGGATDIKVDQLQRLLTVDTNTSKEHHHHQRLAQEFCMENITKTRNEDSLFVDKFNTFNKDQLKKMLAPFKNSMTQTLDQDNLFVDKFNTFNKDQLKKMLAPFKNSMIQTMDEDNLFVDKFNTFNKDQLEKMLAPLENSFNFSDVTIPLEEETKLLRNLSSETDSPTLPYNSVNENTAANSQSDVEIVEATLQYELCETNFNGENDDTMNSKKRKLSTVIENLAKRIKFEHHQQTC